MSTLYKQVEKFQDSKNNDLFKQIVQCMEPNITRSLKQTVLQERDDLKQELILILYEKTLGYPLDKVPGFGEFEKSLLTKTEGVYKK
jgi:hypothetical protein